MENKGAKDLRVFSINDELDFGPHAGTQIIDLIYNEPKYLVKDFFWSNPEFLVFDLLAWYSDEIYQDPAGCNYLSRMHVISDQRKLFMLALNENVELLRNALTSGHSYMGEVNLDQFDLQTCLGNFSPARQEEIRMAYQDHDNETQGTYEYAEKETYYYITGGLGDYDEWKQNGGDLSDLFEQHGLS